VFENCKVSKSIHEFNIMRSLSLLPFLCLSALAEPSREDVLTEMLRPYTGPIVKGVDPSTLTGKLMVGYQGWFNAPGDGAERGWVHWSKRKDSFAPGSARIDLWPDLSELTAAERFKTGFELADGRPAEVFSSFKKETVLRHFQWMRDYGIDGAFVQRFPSDLGGVAGLRHCNTVLSSAREGANQHGRTYAVMYDLSGLGVGGIQKVIEDWKALRTRMKVTEDPAYLHHEGKPLVAVWGIGFNDKRAYTLAECRKLVEFLKTDGCAMMLGVPTGWRSQDRDAVKDPALHELLALADVLSPWTVGRYRNPSEAKRHGEKTWLPDVAWCVERKIDFLPVVFPGFSWANMQDKTLDEIPRMKGEFLWSQFVAAKRSGASMIYVAMFDEVDEGTAIFKCTNDLPVGEGVKFLTYDGLPSDHYLKLTGAGGRLLRGELPMADAMPSLERK
jgi:hypothetical protein